MFRQSVGVRSKTALGPRSRLGSQLPGTGRSLEGVLVASCLLVLAVLLVPPAAAEREWEWQHPHPVGHGLEAVWGSGPDDVYAVGPYGAVVHYDGREWTLLDVPTVAWLRAVWGSGPDDVYVVGSDGTILHFDGRHWLGVDLVDKNLRDVWGSGREDVYVVGDKTLLHFDGSSWSPLSEVVQKAYVFAWGGRGDGVWVRTDGQDDPVRRFARGEWVEMENDEWVHGRIIGRSQWGDFALKPRSALVHLDGMEATPIEYPPVPYHPPITAAWGTGPGNLHIKGGLNLMLHYDGTEWRQLEANGMGIRAMWGSGADDVFAVGKRGKILHYDGASWHEMSRAVVDPRSRLEGVWGTGPDNVYAVGEKLRIAHFDGNRWRLVHGQETDLKGRRLDSLRQHGFARLRWLLMDVWGSAADDIYAVGGAGTVLHFDGQSWSEVDVGTQEHLFAVWGSAADNVWITGDHGTVLRFDGLVWARVDCGATGPLVAVSGSSSTDVHVMETDRRPWTVRHWDGAGWTEHTLPASSWCENMLQRSDCPVGLSEVRDDGVVTAVCMDSVARYDGVAWSRVEVPEIGRADIPSLAGVCSTGPDNLYAVSRVTVQDGRTAVLHHDGAAWRVMEAGRGVELEAVWCAPNDEVFAVGTAILHLDPRPEPEIHSGGGSEGDPRADREEGSSEPDGTASSQGGRHIVVAVVVLLALGVVVFLLIGRRR